MLVVELINALCTTDPGLTDDLASILSDLTLLNNSENSKVALRARQVGINSYYSILSAWK